MIQSFSPLTRRILAIGVLVLALLVAVNVASGVAASVTAALDDLDDSRYRLARLEAIAKKPALPAAEPIPQNVAFSAPDHEAAAGQVTQALNAAAATSQLTLAGISAAPQDRSNPGLISVAVAATGPEQPILAFIGEVEKGSPVIRLRSWTIRRASPDSPELAFEGVAVASWGGAP